MKTFSATTRAHCQLHLLEKCSSGVEDLAVRVATEGGSSTNGGESLNKREVMVLVTLRDLFALSMIEEVKNNFPT